MTDQLTTESQTKPVRLNNETQGEYELFLSYRSLDSRDLISLAEIKRVPLTTLKYLARTYRREERLLEEDIKAAESNMPEVTILNQETSDLATMRAKHMQIAENKLAVGNRGLMLIDKHIKEAMLAQASNKPPPRKLSITIDQIVKLIESGAKLQRLTLGEASEITESKEDFDLSKLDEHQLIEFKSLMLKAKPKKA